MTSVDRPHGEEHEKRASRTMGPPLSFETRPSAAPQDEGGKLARLREWARLIRRDVVALYLAAGDPRVPWHAKALAACVAAYALSPIDLIPDFVPVLGYFDDLVIVPFGILLVVRMIPPQIMAEHRVTAAAATARPASTAGAIVIIAIWTALTALACWYVYGLLA